MGVRLNVRLFLVCQSLGFNDQVLAHYKPLGKRIFQKGDTSQLFFKIGVGAW